MAPLPAVALALSVVLLPEQIGLAAKFGVALGFVHKVNDGDVATTEQLFPSFTVTV